MKLKKPPLICRIKAVLCSQYQYPKLCCTLGQKPNKACSSCKCNVRAQILEGFREGVERAIEKFIIIHKK